MSPSTEMRYPLRWKEFDFNILDTEISGLLFRDTLSAYDDLLIIDIRHIYQFYKEIIIGNVGNVGL